MTIIEKVSYLKGLAEGLSLDENVKSEKIIKAMIDVLDDIALMVSDLEGDIVDISDQVDAVDVDLADIEDIIYEEDEDEEEFYQLTCPECGEDIYIDDEMLDVESLNCPACGTKIEFDFDICSCHDDECNCSDSE